jgi:hypothetical protein
MLASLALKGSLLLPTDNSPAPAKQTALSSKQKQHVVANMVLSRLLQDSWYYRTW